jgi:hypothetical protein
MAWTKAKATVAVAVGVILVCVATIMLLRARSRSVKYHALVLHAYTHNHLSSPAYEEVLDNLRANVWPKERKLAEAKIAARQRANDTVNATTIDLKPYVNAKHYGPMNRSLYKSTFANPQPDLTVSTVDYVSTMTATAPFLVGLTVE